MIGEITIKGKERKMVFVAECQDEKEIIKNLYNDTKQGVTPKVTYTETGIVISYEAKDRPTVLEVTSPSHPPQLFADLVESSHKQQYRVEPRE